MPGGINEDLFGLVDHALVFILLIFVHNQIGEHRLDIAGYVAVLDGELRIQREAAPRHIEASIGAQQGVKRGQVGVVDRNVEIEFGTLAASQKSPAHMSSAATHEFAVERQLRRALRLMVAQVPELQVGVGDEKFKRRVAYLVIERETAAFDVELADFNIDRTPIVLFFDGFARNLNALCLGILSLGSVDICNPNPVEDHVVNVDIGYLRRIFDETVAGESASRDENIDMAAGRCYSIQRYVCNGVSGFNARERLQQVVCPSLQR